MKIAREGDVAIVSFTGNCIGGAEEIANASVQLRAYTEANPPRRMVFDFSSVTFISSRVLSLLLETRSRLEPHQGELVIASLSEQLQRVFAMANLDGAFHFYPDRSTALETRLQSRTGASPGAAA